MPVPVKPPYPALFFLLLSLGEMSACTYREPVAFPVYGAGGDAALYGFSPAAVSGEFSLSKAGVFDYAFEKAVSAPAQGALEVDYRIRGRDGAYRVLLSIEGEAAWVLPQDASFLGIAPLPTRIRYVIPFNTALDKIRIQITLTEEATQAEQAAPSEEEGGGVFELRSLSLVPRWYGFTQEAGREFTLRVSPFVFPLAGDSRYPYRFSIDPPAPYRMSGGIAVYAQGAASQVRLTQGSRRFDYTAASEGAGAVLSIPSGALSPLTYPVQADGEGPFTTFMLLPAQTPAFPQYPVIADPGLILGYPQQNWRDPRYELFQWEDFPSILIFDTADYQVQDALFKRLAFFTEKAGFRGRLASDAEIADLHGWNAHDYRAQDLAAFFEAARGTTFPLSPEERELEGILAAAGIIVRHETGVWAPGEGAIISISRESAEYLRSRFMVHEGFHGLFFIDEEFRDFSTRRFAQLDRGAKGFLLSFFDYQHYDIKDSYLMINEFMAHVLQQPVSHAASYFGEYLARQIDASSWRRTVLPPMDEETQSWPDLAGAFNTEATTFSAYVNQRWGFAAGKIHRIQVR
ncbi:MAG: hypothetical protein LBD74_03455 [Spirochaetaceae bacterium]|jgi:hypothetical protein|nr:hypothetical protein [Spirochaetaceae bacterium]